MSRLIVATAIERRLIIREWVLGTVNQSDREIQKQREEVGKTGEARGEIPPVLF